MSSAAASEKRALARVQRAIADIRKGKMVILTDDESRENEGDLVMAAEKVTPSAVNFMAREGRGLICLSLTDEQVKQLHLPLMVTDNTSSFGTAFTVSIEAAHGVSTGISAADRSHTIKTAVAVDAKPSDLGRPGHVFPLRARAGGVLVRPGQTEGSVDLARLAGLNPSGVICEIMNDDGTMARRPDLEKFSKKHRLALLSVADIITFRLAHERLVRRVGQSVFTRAPWGEFSAYAYTSDVNSAVHLALVRGDVSGDKPVLTRVHRATMLGDMLDAATGEGSLRAAFEHIVKAGQGVILLVNNPVTGPEALRVKPASNEQSVPGHQGESRLKEFGIGAQILQDLGVRRLRLLTNTPNTIVGVERYGLEVVEQRQLSQPGVAKPPKAPKSKKH